MMPPLTSERDRQAYGTWRTGCTNSRWVHRACIARVPRAKGGASEIRSCFIGEPLANILVITRCGDGHSGRSKGICIACVYCSRHCR